MRHLLGRVRRPSLARLRCMAFGGKETGVIEEGRARETYMHGHGEFTARVLRRRTAAHRRREQVSADACSLPIRRS